MIEGYCENCKRAICHFKESDVFCPICGCELRGVVKIKKEEVFRLRRAR
jgi:uncharacterized Zn finger protein (UPF0148 family)